VTNTKSQLCDQPKLCGSTNKQPFCRPECTANLGYPATKIIYQLVDSNPSTSTPGFACAQQRRKRHFHGTPASISIPVTMWTWRHHNGFEIETIKGHG
jgi:hypothetical protein